MEPATASVKPAATSSAVEPATASMKTTAAVEAAATESSEAAPGATHHGSGMKTASCRSRSVTDAVGITASSNIVRAGAPVTGVCTEVMVIVTVPASVPAVPISVPEEPSLIYPPRRIETPAERAIENPVARNEGEGVKPGIPIPIGSSPAWAAPSILRVHASRIDVGFGQVTRPQTAPAEQIAFLIGLLVELTRLRQIIAGQREFTPTLHVDMFMAALYNALPSNTRISL